MANRTFRYNETAGTGNPVRITDINKLWDALDGFAEFTAGKTTPRVISGLEYDSDANLFSSGFMAFDGKLYWMADPYPLGTNIYAHSAQIDQRVFQDGVTRPVYTVYWIENEPTGGTLVGTLTQANVRNWRWGVDSIGPEQVYALRDGIVAGQNILAETITTANLADDVLERFLSLHYAAVGITGVPSIDTVFSYGYENRILSVENYSPSGNAYTAIYLNLSPTAYNQLIRPSVSVTMSAYPTDSSGTRITPTVEFYSNRIGILFYATQGQTMSTSLVIRPSVSMFFNTDN